MYKLILMDFSMPECDGPQATKNIRKYLSDEGKANSDYLFICCLTAYSESTYQNIAKEAGVDCFLTKPVFKKTIHKLLI